MKITTLSVAVLVATVFVPGVISKATLAYLVPVRRLEKESLWFQTLIHSAFPLLVFSLGVGQDVLAEDSQAAAAAIFADSKTVCWWIFATTIVPAVQGVVIATALTHQKLRKLLTWCGLTPLMPYPTAWDYVLHSMTSSAYVIVTTKTGRIGGVFGQQSYAALAANGRDIFLQELWSVREGTWELEEPSRGCWISGEEILYLDVIWSEDGDEQSEEND